MVAIAFAVYGHNSVEAEVFIGQAKVVLEPGHKEEQWFPLLDGYGQPVRGKDGKDAEIWLDINYHSGPLS